ncbi:MAG: DUF202 domain-containing protein [Nitrospirae bacterium]|nr:DUF202 domain-containing protein [Nitrospirota bacterium]
MEMPDNERPARVRNRRVHMANERTFLSLTFGCRRYHAAGLHRRDAQKRGPPDVCCKIQRQEYD